MRVARWRCPEARETFSLLPDCLSSRLEGSLDETEQVVMRVEVSRSVERAAASLRPEIDLPGAVRWVRRRLQGVRAALVTLITLLPGQLGEVAQLHAVREFLGAERCLVALREIGAVHLRELPGPVGFRPPVPKGRRRGRGHQHGTGNDPPGSSEV